MLLRVSFFFLVASISNISSASSSLLTGELGQWLESTAAPDLIDVLSNHPRFKGETIRFVIMKEGKPTDNSDGLSRAIQNLLTQRLVRDGKVRLAWLNQRPSCRAPIKIPYLLGLEVSRRGYRDHSVSIAMVDVEEAVWVNGVGVSWAGRLTRDERLALKTPVSEAYRGSIASPLHVTNTTEIVGILKERMKCSLKAGLEGTVYIAPSENAELAGLTHALDNELSIMTIASITNNQTSADWHMITEVEPVGNGSYELRVLLQPGKAPREGLGNVQRLASVYITGIKESKAHSPTIQTSPREPPTKPIVVYSPPHASQPILLSTLSMEPSAPSGICDIRRARVNACVEVELELLEPAYLLVFRTNVSEVTPTTCDRRIHEATTGTHRYRLRVLPNTRAVNRPDAGIYVVATTDQKIAADLAKHLRRAPGACTNSTRGSIETWLGEFQRLLQTHDNSLQWRALHMRHATAGIVAI